MPGRSVYQHGPVYLSPIFQSGLYYLQPSVILSHTVIDAAQLFHRA